MQSVDARVANWSTLDNEVIASLKRGDIKSATVLVDGAANSASDALSNRLSALTALVRREADSASA